MGKCFCAASENARGRPVCVVTLIPSKTMFPGEPRKNMFLRLGANYALTCEINSLFSLFCRLRFAMADEWFRGALLPKAAPSASELPASPNDVTLPSPSMISVDRFNLVVGCIPPFQSKDFLMVVGEDELRQRLHLSQLHR